MKISDRLAGEPFMSWSVSRNRRPYGGERLPDGGLAGPGDLTSMQTGLVNGSPGVKVAGQLR
jgi:hypothetical protein